MEYLLKASAVIVIFYTCYKVFLERDTFFNQNRWFLLAGLIAAMFIPYIVIPIYVEQTVTPLEGFVFADATIQTETNNTFNLVALLTYAYLVGVLIFAIRFILQLRSLTPILLKNKSNKTEAYKIIKTTKDISPFSFFNYIVYNPDKFSDTELEQIITHEKVHVRQHHTLDIILAQIACIIFWFNPVIWLYNKDLKQNLEFIADETAINYSSCKKSYQYTLLKTSMPTHQLALTNNFYNSLIKKRIVMLHKSKSKKINLLKYTLVIPVLAVFLMSFNTKEVIIENALDPVKTNSLNELLKKNQSDITKEIKTASIEVIIKKDFTDSDFEKLKLKFKNEGLTLKVKGIKRNDKGEITAIKIDLSSKTSNANYSIEANESIKPIKISVDDDGKNISIGNARNVKSSNMVFITKDGEKHNINHSDSENNVFVISSDDVDDSDVQVDEFIIKNGDSLHIKKFHKNIKSDEDMVFITKDGKYKRVLKGVKITSKDEKEPLFIVDGKVISKKEMNDIDPNNIDKVEVVKGDGAIQNYGEKGANGVIIIKRKEKNISKLIDLEKTPLYILDGKEITQKEMNDIDPDTIDSLKVLKGESATKKYHDKGKNGVIVITLKK